MNSGSLCLHAGVLYVGSHAKTARVASYDLGGRFLAEHAVFRDKASGRSSASGLALDDDHRLWVADAAAHRLRCFTLFGRELLSFGDPVSAQADRPDRPGTPVDVLALPGGEELTLAVASGGPRRHGVHLLELEAGRTRSLRPMGDGEGRFQGVQRLASQGRFLYVVEGHARRVQVFREGEFHYAFRVPRASGDAAYISAIAPLEDGRLALALAGEESALVIVDRNGRQIEVLAEHGPEEGAVLEPAALVVEPGSSDRRACLAVLDHAGQRIQLFNLEGRFYGVFAGLG